MKTAACQFLPNGKAHLVLLPSFEFCDTLMVIGLDGGHLFLTET